VLDTTLDSPGLMTWHEAAPPVEERLPATPPTTRSRKTAASSPYPMQGLHAVLAPKILSQTVQTEFLATHILPGLIGHSILRTSVKPQYIPLSHSQDPVLLSHIFLPERNRSLVLRHFNFEKSDSGKGCFALSAPRGGGVGNPPPNPPPRPKCVKLEKT